MNGFSDDHTGLYQSWTFAPPDFGQRIPQQPLPVHMNLWLFDGHAPADHRDVDIAITGFRFTPDCRVDAAANTCT